ncbi:hypothetical protein C8R45DRAFT_1221437 [Mycena sanguinolenta]|nr:hypothetical protein C8R45DRAFT_1221437 [Mycena sanguinolenta]
MHYYFKFFNSPEPAETCLGLGRRTLRSGKEFSAFDLAVGVPLAPREFFSVADCLKERLDAQQITRIFDEHEDTATPFYQNTVASPPSSPALSTLLKSNQSTPPDQPSTSGEPLTAAERKKLGSKRRKQQRREQDRAESSDPKLKSVYFKRREAARKNVLQTTSDTTALPHTKPGWIGKLQSEDGSESPNVNSPSPDALPAVGMVPHSYTQEDVDRLSGTTGFLYVPWGGEVAIPIVDSSRRNFALLGGKPRDLVGWQKVTDGASELMCSLLGQGHFTNEDWHHRRANPDTPFPAVSRGLSHGGGQTRPGELQNHPINTEITDKMLAHIFYQRIVGFTNCLVLVFASTLFEFCQSQMARLAEWDRSLRWPFESSIFAACTFNFGPRASTCPHLDFGNLAWGWCAITALGSFDADRGGHLILWDLKMVIRFPAGATILIPSAILRHSNVPVQRHEMRSSFVQYTAGGLFRWVRNGFMTDEDFDRVASISTILVANTSDCPSDSHSEILREKARERMKKLRLAQKNTGEARSEHRMSADFTYRERLYFSRRRRQNYTEKYGNNSFHDFYLPLATLFGADTLNGVTIVDKTQKLRAPDFHLVITEEFYEAKKKFWQGTRVKLVITDESIAQ